VGGYETLGLLPGPLTAYPRQEICHWEGSLGGQFGISAEDGLARCGPIVAYSFHPELASSGYYLF